MGITFPDYRKTKKRKTMKIKGRTLIAKVVEKLTDL